VLSKQVATLTPLAVEAALQVSAGLEHRAAKAGALRAAHVERARYHAGLARCRYLAAGPASRQPASNSCRRRPGRWRMPRA
jgi:hypothetical protein